MPASLAHKPFVCPKCGEVPSVIGEAFTCLRCGVALIPTNDPVLHPSHYCAGQIEPIDVIEDWNLGFHLGNVVKYLARSAHKGRELEDLKKAQWYLSRKIKNLEAANNPKE